MTEVDSTQNQNCAFQIRYFTDASYWKHKLIKYQNMWNKSLRERIFFKWKRRTNYFVRKICVHCINYAVELSTEKHFFCNEFESYFTENDIMNWWRVSGVTKRISEQKFKKTHVRIQRILDSKKTPPLNPPRKRPKNMI